MTEDRRPIAIVGGDGKTGRRVAARLEHMGRRVRRVSRSTDPAFDWNESDSWPAAVAGARSAYVTYQPDLSVPQAYGAIARLAGLARDARLEHVVLLSGRGEDGARRAEEALAAAGVCWTVVRASWFAQNFSESFLADAVRAGELALPVGAVAEPFVDADDIADVVVAALTGATPSRRIYEVTGPAALTFAEAAEILGRVIGRPLIFRELTPAAFAEHLRAAGLPDSVVAMLIEVFGTTLDGRNSAVAAGVEEALGRPARTFENYAKLAATTDVWRN